MIKLGKDTLEPMTLGSTGKSGFVPLPGNAIEWLILVGGKNKDFPATYSIRVKGTMGTMGNNLQSLATMSNSTAINVTSSNK